MKILIVTDAWTPQINGVVRTLSQTVAACRAAGHSVEIIAPSDGYITFPLPTYPDIRLAPFAFRDVERRMIKFAPDAIHIATEGPLGNAARNLCIKWGFSFTTSYHTKFPEYIKARFPFIPLSWAYGYVRNFHNSGGRTMIATDSLREMLEGRGFTNMATWARGVDLKQFHPRMKNAPEDVYAGLERPVFVNIGRVSVEKNIGVFLGLDLPGTQVIVGDGPQLLALKKAYPNAIFTGAKSDDELARHFADADVFVFPSLTDTFGLVNIEAMASGTPVAAYPACGPVDIIDGSDSGKLAGVCDTDLRAACMAALNLKSVDCVAHAQNYSWDAVSDIFMELLTPQYKPTARKKWRRIRRLYNVTASPYHLIRKSMRRASQTLRGKKWPKK
ncbi:MAG: glycosyltransferase family 1 protein [Robiginitomaculum sp.]